jgi:TldD protein
VIARLDSLTGLGAALCARAQARGVFLIWRAQARATSHVVVRDGRAEDTAVGSSSGHGVQVVTAEGATALASRDDFEPQAAQALLDRTVAAAAAGPTLGLASSAMPSLVPVKARAVPAGLETFARIDLDAVRRRLAEIEAAIAGECPGTSLRLSFSADLDCWRIVRSDGADVVFAMPRCTMRVQAGSGDGGSRHVVGASVSGPLPTLPWDDAAVNSLLRRGRESARLAAALPDAPAFPSGSVQVVLDYALAKGLAHEAFGHASEADGLRSSILARDGRFRAGERVGAAHVSIVDEPIPNDHAWQPFSANGVPRERATLVDHGVLHEALTDPFSAARTGLRLTGAERAESYRSAPIPRMTNIRIECDAPLPAPGAFEDYGPDQVRDLLAGAGVLSRHPRIAFLSGYSGGQVNTATGDFVFNCKAIWEISRDRIALRRPAIFSGSMFGALASIREAFGPLRLDAIGTCGKWGQSVPSSGGSHHFLVLDADDSVRLGGS